MNNADSVWINAKVYTVDKTFSIKESFAIKDGIITFVGNSKDAMQYVGDGTNLIDLQGHVVLPGLNDAHIHLEEMGLVKNQIDASGKNKEEIIAEIGKAIRNRSGNGWIVGWGWNQTLWDPPQFPTKEDLDAISDSVPILLHRSCSHIIWVNSKALEISGVTNETPDPVGGAFLRSDDGQLSGIITEQARKTVERNLPPLKISDKKNAILAAQEELLHFGITSASDAGTSKENIAIIKELYAEDKLKIRLNLMFCSDMRAAPEKVLYATKEYTAGGIEVGLYKNRLQIRCVKIFIDGALGGRTAWLLEDYSDQKGYRGVSKLSDEELYSIVLAACKDGFQVSAHAIGDAANKQVLKVYQKVLGNLPSDNRLRIEHAQVVAADDFYLFKKLGIIPSMQTIHAASDMNMAEDRLGLERIKRSYSWRKFIDSGLIVPNGTDAPIESVNPWANIYFAVTRKDKNRKSVRGWSKRDAMTREEALRSYTIWPAYASFEENIKGSLEIGKAADFIVIDNDIMLCNEEEIPNINVLRTVIGGEEQKI